MSHWPVNYVHISTVSNVTVGGEAARLVCVNINTGTATAVLTIRDGSSTGPVIAILDASAKGTYRYGEIRSQFGGFYLSQTVAASDITVSYV
jgi:hypothetical protein